MDTVQELYCVRVVAFFVLTLSISLNQGQVLLGFGSSGDMKELETLLRTVKCVSTGVWCTAVQSDAVAKKWCTCH